MKKVPIIILLLFIVSISLGCNRGEPKRQDIKIHTGTQGLVLKFLPQTPPNIAYSGETMDIQIEVSNKGAYTTNGLLYFTGFDKSIIDIGFECHYGTKGRVSSNVATETANLKVLEKLWKYF